MATVLLVEDDEVLHRVMRRILEKAGHEVLSAWNGQLALDELAASPEPIDLAILDLGLPKLGGAALVAAIRQAAPEMPVLVTSGYPDVAERFGLELGELDFLPKPFGPHELADRVARVLATR